MSLTLRKIEDPRMTAEMLLLIRELFLEAVEWAAQSQGEVTTAQVIATMQLPNTVWRMAVEDEKLVGLIGVSNINWIDRTCEPVLAIMPEFRRRRYGLTISKAFRDFITEVLGLRRIQTIVLEDAPSRHLIEQLGGVQEGILRAMRWKDGRYVNGIQYGWIKE